MSRTILVTLISLVLFVGGLITLSATAQERSLLLRGISDPFTETDLPYRQPLFGVNADLRLYTEDDRLNQHLTWMRSAGVHWVRQVVRWESIEPMQGVYAWDTWDRLITAVADADLALIPVFVNSPDWARSSSDRDITGRPDDPADFGRFVGAFAARYGDRITTYQIWDEPNLASAWGGDDPRPAGYLALLSAAYRAIHAVDADASVIAAALAPTVEQGGRNISDLLFLDALYALGGADYFDAAAGKPYGFSAAADDRVVSSSTLNFSRLIALREVMTRWGDGAKPLWGSAWGWNSLPVDWRAEPSIWGSVSEDNQHTWTIAALERADREWAWIGGLILTHWQPPVAPDDPFQGFSIIDPDDRPTLLYESLAARAAHPISASHGLHRATSPFVTYSGLWTFGDLGADIGWVRDSRLTFDFAGQAVGMILRREDYVGFAYVTIDERPPNALPHVGDVGFLSLTSAAQTPEVVRFVIARDLAPTDHRLAFAADEGWDRWAIVGFVVAADSPLKGHDAQIAIAGVISLIAAVNLLWAFTATRPNRWGIVRRLLDGLGRGGRLLIGGLASVAVMIGVLLTWYDGMPAIFRRDPTQLGIALLTSGLVYLQPHIILVAVGLIVLFVIIYHDRAIGLALSLFYAPLFLFPVELYRFAFPMAELLLLTTTGAWGLRLLVDYRRRVTSVSLRITTLDGLMIAWLIAGAIAFFVSDVRAPAATELRVLFIEPFLFYLIVRTTIRDRRGLLMMIDALLAAGAIVALIGLVQYVRGDAIITAEAGIERLASVYGSPNNVGLMIGRCLPFAVAFALAPLDRRRRILAAVIAVIMAIALLLTFSAGAILLGVPAGLGTVILLLYGRRLWRFAWLSLPIAGAAGVLVATVPRLARAFDLSEGTSFFRIRLWGSALNMLGDQPLTGIGLDQFLYAYRGRYIFPDAWQELNLSHPHNILLDVWLRMGVIGVLLLIGLQAVFWRQIVRCLRAFRGSDTLLWAVAIGTAGSMINLLAHGLVDNSIFVQDLAIVFSLLIGAATILDNLLPQRKPSDST